MIWVSIYPHVAWTTPSPYKKKLLTLYGPLTSLKFQFGPIIILGRRSWNGVYLAILIIQYTRSIRMIPNPTWVKQEEVAQGILYELGVSRFSPIIFYSCCSHRRHVFSTFVLFQEWYYQKEILRSREQGIVIEWSWETNERGQKWLINWLINYLT